MKRVEVAGKSPKLPIFVIPLELETVIKYF